MHDLSDDSNEQGSSTEEENQTGDDTEFKERYILFLQYLNEQIKFYILDSQISQNNLSKFILHSISQKNRNLFCTVFVSQQIRVACCVCRRPLFMLIYLVFL